MTTTDIILAIVFQLGMMSLNIWTAHWEAHRFDVDQKPINHKLAALIYGIWTLWIFTCIPLFHWKVLWLWFAFIAMHFPVFSIALNKFRKPPRAWDYHNTEDLKGSKWDLLIDKHYDEVLFGSVAAWIFLQFLIFWK